MKELFQVIVKFDLRQAKNHRVERKVKLKQFLLKKIAETKAKNP